MKEISLRTSKELKKYAINPYVLKNYSLKFTTRLSTSSVRYVDRL